MGILLHYHKKSMREMSLLPFDRSGIRGSEKLKNSTRATTTREGQSQGASNDLLTEDFFSGVPISSLKALQVKGQKGIFPVNILRATSGKEKLPVDPYKKRWMGELCLELISGKKKNLNKTLFKKEINILSSLPTKSKRQLLLHSCWSVYWEEDERTSIKAFSRQR
ncbi:uncharacterized protein LOC143649445 [Tamandua tetradactyla]|uniref:uncharacterized protein LOC143649445 n=1 Tax=Tamandua tetradactyla TaxID=48850 RepID=UPI004053AF9E